MNRLMKPRRDLRGRILGGAATMIVAVGALSACSGAPVSVQATTAASLQSSVLDISTAASGGDFETALTLLASVESDLRTAAAAGQVTPERSAEIQSAITAVNAELLTAIADAEPEPVPTPAPTVTVTPTPTPAPTSDDDEDSRNDGVPPDNGDSSGNDNSQNGDDTGTDGKTDKENTENTEVTEDKEVTENKEVIENKGNTEKNQNCNNDDCE